MLTTAELHIDFDLKLQQVSSFKFRKFETYEVDWFLNKSYLAFVRTKIDEVRTISGGIKNTTNRLDELAPIVKTATIELFKEDNSNYFGFVPSLYFGDLSERLSYYDCAEKLETSVSNKKYTFAVAKLDKTKFGSSNLTFEIRAVYTRPNLTQYTEKIFDLSDFYSVALSVDYDFYLINLILEEVNRTQTKVKVYWEQYDNIYRPNSLIFVTGEGAVLDVLDRIDYIYTTTVSDFFNKEIGGLVSTIVETENPVIKEDDCRMIDREVLHRHNKNPFAKTKKNSPLLSLKGDRIYVSCDDSFIPKSIILDYFRKPNMLNYEINRNPELGIREVKQDSSNKIVNDAVTYALSVISRNFNLIKQENLTND